MQLDILKKLGFNDKNATIYLALLRLGPSSVRKLAEFCDLNRGTTYDSLKWLQDEGIVTFYQKDTKQYFVAEKPEKLLEMIHRRDVELHELNKDVEKMLPELQALHNKGGERPVARYYAHNELHLILEDVLNTCEQTDDKEYRIYSAEGVRTFLYEDFPTFSDVRVSKGISVNVIAIGDGGELRGLDERKWLKSDKDTNTYILIYLGKTAYISLDAKGEPVGVVIKNDGVYETQKLIFDNLWKNL
ncbi:MAG: hypothetical protein A2479_01550 [Candidatus Magasanikbacteria bacterium RIFOXYC2_FULL_39_8]|nr:MAG: hypothetical protein A2479_01550 [Candidatus Magasanikbacteria bacterium RIFOXYC2_FULL_39_8]